MWNDGCGGEAGQPQLPIVLLNDATGWMVGSEPQPDKPLT